MMPPGAMLPQMIPGMGAPLLMNPMMVPPGHGMPGLMKGGGAASSSSAPPSTMQSAAGAPPGPPGQMQVLKTSRIEEGRLYLCKTASFSTFGFSVFLQVFLFALHCAWD